MSSVLHPRLHTQAVPVGSASPVSHERSLPLLSSSQDKTSAAGQERSRQQLHRLAAVRQQEGLSQYTIARRLGIGLREVQAQEQGSADLTLSMLYRWKESLNVPISELLKEDVGEVSFPVMFRGKLLRVMRTAVTILKRTRNAATHRRAQFMVEQLIEIMPKLKDTTPWPSVGKRRNRRDLGRAAQLRLPADVIRDLDVS